MKLKDIPYDKVWGAIVKTLDPRDPNMTGIVCDRYMDRDEECVKILWLDGKISDVAYWDCGCEVVHV